MGFVRFLRAHVDTVVALALTAGYLVEVATVEATVVGDPYIDGLALDESIGIAGGAVFLLSLAARTQLPLVPLGLAFPALVLLGEGTLDGLLTLALGLLLAAYSTGAWAGGRSGQVGALAVGLLAGLAVVRVAGIRPEARDLAAPLFILVGAWLLGLAVRSLRADRDDERVVGALDWETDAAIPDSAGRDDTVRELRDVVERAMSAVILGARSAAASLDEDPAEARRSLAVVEAAGSEALEEAQRLTGVLLSPDGTPSPEPEPGLADLDFLAEQVTAAGLPVAMRVEGRPLPLTSDLDGVAYRVVQEALMTTLEHARDATASVIVRYERDELQLEIVDDGVGLSDDDVEAQTADLLAVRDEVARLGGTVDAGPGEDRGYWVLARLPYEPAWD